MQATRGDQLNKALKWSFALHGGVLFLAVFKAAVFPSNPVMLAPALRVDMVALPDLLKKDLSQVSKTLPKPDLEEKLQEAAQDAKKVKTVAPPTEEAAKPDEMVIHPKKVDKKAVKEKTEEKGREKKLQSALARIRALEKLKDKDAPEEDDDAAAIIKGNQISKGASLSADAKESAQAGYYDLVRENLVEFWSLPPWLARQKLSAQAIIRIDPAGNVFSTKIIKPSGNPQFDEAILATIRDAQPMPRPPKELQDTLKDHGITVGFPL